MIMIQTLEKDLGFEKIGSTGKYLGICCKKDFPLVWDNYTPLKIP